MSQPTRVAYCNFHAGESGGDLAWRVLYEYEPGRWSPLSIPFDTEAEARAAEIVLRAEFTALAAHFERCGDLDIARALRISEFWDWHDRTIADVLSGPAACEPPEGSDLPTITRDITRNS